IRFLLRCISPLVAVRPEGANHQWRRNPPGELSIDPVADELLVSFRAPRLSLAVPLRQRWHAKTSSEHPRLRSRALPGMNSRAAQTCSRSSPSSDSRAAATAFTVSL